MTYRRKLIEVALPLEAINVASAYEKMPGIGSHPRGIHLWWARRPLTTCRAVLFASLVDDPDQPGLPQAYLDYLDQMPVPASHKLEWSNISMNEQRRFKLFEFIEKLVLWGNSNNPEILKTAHELIMAATEGHPPPVLDPFCGGGSIPLEAQRLGLEAHGSDLNPVAVLITKALIEIPPKFVDQPPVNPESRARMNYSAEWKGASGLAEDVRYYGKWMRDEAEKRIGYLYPKVKLPLEHGGGEAAVIAWLWARTVKCPNPACGAEMPLIRTFELSKKAGKKFWIEPIINKASKTVEFKIETGEGKPPDPPKVGRGAKFLCLVCRQSVEDQHLKDEAKAGRISTQLIAIIVQGKKGRIYLPPTPEQETLAALAKPNWVPEEPLAHDPRNIWCISYGIDTVSKLFTQRQLVALTLFSQLVSEVREQVYTETSIDRYTESASDYADGIATYLAFAVDRSADFNCALARWVPTNEKVMNLFARQAIPMTWDFAEANPIENVVGGLPVIVSYIADCISVLPSASFSGNVNQIDATESVKMVVEPLISTDPPYYDNISYADLSDFFYAWLRRSLGKIYPDIFTTLVTPKTPELIAATHRFEGNKKKAQEFFEEGLGKAFINIRKAQNPDYPFTVYYAFKQAETESNGNINSTTMASTGWETMLEGLILSGFSITGTWPMRSEQSERIIASGTNALASSIVLVCRPRPADAKSASRREFLTALKKELPNALKLLQQGNIAPVDLAQASIGPGMAVFSRYAKVIESDGTPIRVRTALQLINQTLDEVLTEQEGEYDVDTRWAIAWFDQFGMAEGPYGQAETLSKAKNTAVAGLVEAGFLEAKSGKVRLLRRDELDPNWNPRTDKRLTNWEIAQHLIHALDKKGETGAADILAKVGGGGEIARDLAYRLYTTCERKNWSQEALAYNSLVVSWPEISRLAAEPSRQSTVQGDFGF